jgi:hypothetical protein
MRRMMRAASALRLLVLSLTPLAVVAQTQARIVIEEFMVPAKDAGLEL